MKVIRKFFAFIIYLLMIAVCGITIFICLDIFGVIDVPEKYSALKYLSSHLDGIVNEDAVEVVDLPGYYYNQLSDYGKVIYYGLYKNKDNLKTGTYVIKYDESFSMLLDQENGTDKLKSEYELAINALVFDYPELFYVDISKMTLVTEITTKLFFRSYNVYICPSESNYLCDEFQDKEKLDYALKSIEKVKNNLIEQPYSNTIEKLRTVHNYLIDNIEYDETNKDTMYNLYGALVEGKAVCNGYAKAFKYIVDGMGIPCIVVSGTGQNRENQTESHAWNYVLINDVWYAVDVTWDDPIITWVGGGPVKDYKPTSDTMYRYFLVGSDLLFEDHQEDGKIGDSFSFTYPVISKENY